jgi:hypothetical protein
MLCKYIVKGTQPSFTTQPGACLLEPLRCPKQANIRRKLMWKTAGDICLECLDSDCLRDIGQHGDKHHESVGPKPARGGYATHQHRNVGAPARPDASRRSAGKTRVDTPTLDCQGATSRHLLTSRWRQVGGHSLMCHT